MHTYGRQQNGQQTRELPKVYFIGEFEKQKYEYLRMFQYLVVEDVALGTELLEGAAENLDFGCSLAELRFRFVDLHNCRSMLWRIEVIHPKKKLG